MTTAADVKHPHARMLELPIELTPDNAKLIKSWLDRGDLIAVWANLEIGGTHPTAMTPHKPGEDIQRPGWRYHVDPLLVTADVDNFKVTLEELHATVRVSRDPRTFRLTDASLRRLENSRKRIRDALNGSGPSSRTEEGWNDEGRRVCFIYKAVGTVSLADWAAAGGNEGAE